MNPMKRIITVLPVILFVMAGCGGGKQSDNQKNDLIVVDVTASYPKKELILQDFMDVEYIPLETTDDFLCQGSVLAVGKDIILVQNYTNDGNIFIFDRKSGKGLRKINRMGNSGEEYIYYYNIFLDEDNGEIIICDNSKKKTLVYDLYGNFKRNMDNKENAETLNITNFDNDSFIWWNSSFQFDSNAKEMASFFITSKQDGSITKEIEVPFEKRKSTVLMHHDEKSNMVYSIGPSFSSIVPCKDMLLLVEPSSDTIYSCSPEHGMKPFLTRTPSIQSMDPLVFALPGVVTDDYCFMQIATIQYDFATQQGAPSVYLMYDRKAKTFAEYTVYNGDYTIEKNVAMTGGRMLNTEVPVCRKIDAHELVESYEKGELKGELKEIAATLDEESNPVIMLLTHKK